MTLDRLLAATLLVGAAITLIALLRPLVRRLAGVQAQYQVWLLVPAVLLAAGLGALQPERPLRWQIDLPAGEFGLPTSVNAPTGVEPEAAANAGTLLLALWLAGALVCAAVWGHAHRQLLRRRPAARWGQCSAGGRLATAAARAQRFPPALSGRGTPPDPAARAPARRARRHALVVAGVGAGCTAVVQPLGLVGAAPPARRHGAGLRRRAAAPQTSAMENLPPSLAARPGLEPAVERHALFLPPLDRKTAHAAQPFHEDAPPRYGRRVYRAGRGPGLCGATGRATGRRGGGASGRRLFQIAPGHGGDAKRPAPADGTGSAHLQRRACRSASLPPKAPGCWFMSVADPTQELRVRATT